MSSRPDKRRSARRRSPPRMRAGGVLLGGILIVSVPAEAGPGVPTTTKTSTAAAVSQGLSDEEMELARYLDVLEDFDVLRDLEMLEMMPLLEDDHAD